MANRELTFCQTDTYYHPSDGSMNLYLPNEVRFTATGNLELYLALNQTFCGSSGTCFYDGEYYNLDLTIFIDDYYDWYYENPENGEQQLILVNCDEMAWLHLYGFGKNFDSLGICRMNLRWKKGEGLEYAEQRIEEFKEFH